MQILKSLLVVCVAAAICVPPRARGDDSEAIAKAREALRQKMKELDAQTGGAPATVPAVQPAAPAAAPAAKPAAPANAPAAQPAPAAAQPAPAVTKTVEAPKPAPASPKTEAPLTVKIVPAPQSSGAFSALPPPSPAVPAAVTAVIYSRDNLFSAVPARAPESDEIIKARETVRLKIKQLNEEAVQVAAATRANQAQAAAAARKQQEQAAATTKPKVDKTTPAGKATSEQAVATTKPNSEQAAAAARAAKAAEIDAATKKATAQAAAKPAPVEYHAKPAKKSNKLMAWQPLTPPALPISMDKEQRLLDLLQQYKAEAITPQQYHETRARILDEK